MEEYLATHGKQPGHLESYGAKVIANASGKETPSAAAQFSARVLEADYRTNTLTGQRFIHATVDGSFAYDICLPDIIELPEKNSVISGTAVLVASVLAPQGCGTAGGGCGSGSCGCGGH